MTKSNPINRLRRSRLLWNGLQKNWKVGKSILLKNWDTLYVETQIGRMLLDGLMKVFLLSLVLGLLLRKFNSNIFIQQMSKSLILLLIFYNFLVKKHLNIW